MEGGGGGGSCTISQQTIKEFIEIKKNSGNLIFFDENSFTKNFKTL